MQSKAIALNVTEKGDLTEEGFLMSPIGVHTMQPMLSGMREKRMIWRGFGPHPQFLLDI